MTVDTWVFLPLAGGQECPGNQFSMLFESSKQAKTLVKIKGDRRCGRINKMYASATYFT
jgi:hypothetical protein